MLCLTGLLVNYVFLVTLKIGDCMVCYKSLGCFSQNSPWFSVIRPFPPPNKPESIDTKLYFYRSEDNKRYNVTLHPNISLDGGEFDSNKKTVFIIHGFASDGNSSWVSNIKDMYFKNEDVNVFLVDWGRGASGINYLQVAANTRVVGAELVRFGKYLIESEGLNKTNMHLIGHSLGAHICSYMAKGLNDKEKVGRITGLDVAQPGFQGASSAVRLVKEDAGFVDAIHTDAKPFIPFFGFGFVIPTGHVDFYLNNGANQPGCLDLKPLWNVTSIKQLATITVDVIASLISCSHVRSHDLYTYILNPDLKCAFTGFEIKTFLPTIFSITRCDRFFKCASMGLTSVMAGPRGSFQVFTSGSAPYCCRKGSFINGCY